LSFAGRRDVLAPHGTIRTLLISIEEVTYVEDHIQPPAA
jgi:hypothetical protein